MKNFIHLLLLACLFSMVLVVSVAGQTTNGAIQGTVVDPQGAAVVGASVTGRNMDTGLTVAASTSSAGLFSLQNLPPGRYVVTVEFAGMKKFAQEGITVGTNSTVGLDVKLQVGATTENITVSADASQLETETSDIGASVPSSLVANLPLEVSGTIRNPVQFITLIPGFVGNVGNDPGSNASDDFKVNGGQEGGTDILVDGVSISLVSPNTQWNKGVSTEAVQEFKVLQSNFSPEFGESGDGIVNLTMKSGTNALHGSAYDFLRNRVLDANSWTNNILQLKKPINTQNDFGFTIGGPVVLPHLYDGRNKTFFFFDYEGFRFQTGGTNIDSLPPAAFRSGDFSADCTEGFTAGICNNLGHQLYDPVTHNAIPGNLLSNDPNYAESTVMKNVFGLIPTPTFSNLTNNTVDRSLSQTRANLWDLKIDQVISDKQRISFGFDYDNTNTGGTSSLGPIFGSHTPQNTRYARLGHNYIVSPTVVNQFLFGFSRRWRGEISDSVGQGYPDKIGLVGVRNNTFPCLKWNGSPYQVNNCGDSEFADNVFQINDSVSWVKGKHAFKFGGGTRLLQFNVRRLTQASGEFDFSSAQTSNGGTGGDPVASSLFGLSDTSTLNYGGFSGVRYKDFYFFGQDTYRVTNRLNVNYGLRYDVDIPATEAQDRFSVVDPNLSNPGAGGILGAYTYFGTGTGRNGRKRPQDIYTKALGPRVGFAYSINDKTVLRGGYGIFYEPLKEGSFADQDSLGFFNRQTITSTNGGPLQLDNPIPHLFPNLGPFTPEGQNGSNGVIIVPANSGRPADIQSWNLDVQRQILKNLSVSVAYVGSKGSHLPALNWLPNQVNPKFLSLGPELLMNVSCLTGGTCPNAVAAGVTVPYAGFNGNINQALRPFPQYGNFNLEDNSFTPDRSGSSTYHAMQLQVNKRMAEGLSFLVSYTVSKNITDADSAGPGVSGFIGTNSFAGQNSYNRAAEKSVSELDTPQSLVASFFYELPVGRGKAVLNKGGVVDRVVGGWYFSGVGRYQSGLPTEVYQGCSGTAGDVLFAGCQNYGTNARVNVIPGVPQTNKAHFNFATTPFFNPAAFSLVNTAGSGPLAFGNERRSLDGARAWGGRNEDFTIGKRTRLFGEKASIDFRAEFFNIFNRHIFQQPGGTGGFATTLNTPFQAAGSDPKNCPGPLACGFGAVTSTTGPRTIQFGLKIEY